MQLPCFPFDWNKINFVILPANNIFKISIYDTQLQSMVVFAWGLSLNRNWDRFCRVEIDRGVEVSSIFLWGYSHWNSAIPYPFIDLDCSRHPVELYWCDTSWRQVTHRYSTKVDICGLPPLLCYKMYWKQWVDEFSEVGQMSPKQWVGRRAVITLVVNLDEIYVLGQPADSAGGLCYCPRLSICLFSDGSGVLVS